MSASAVVINIAGGSGSGKTTTARNIQELLRRRGIQCEILSADNWFQEGSTNFDIPHAYDWEDLIGTLTSLLDTSSDLVVTRPQWDYCTHRRLDTRVEIPSADCYIVEGIFTLTKSEMREIALVNVFVDTDDDVRLVRRLKRDITERGRTVEDVLDVYLKQVKPGFDAWIARSRQHADIIIPNNKPMIITRATQLIVDYVLVSCRRFSKLK